VGSAARSATVNELANGTSYTFTVKAKNAMGASPASPPSVAVTPLSVPDAPAGVGAAARNNGATISWAAPSHDGGTPVTNYVVMSSPDNKTVNVGASLTSATITGLTNGAAYTFTVRAVNSVGAGPWSPASNAVTPNNTVPAAPINVIAAAG